MSNFVTFQDGDFDSASTFGFMAGRENASDYVELGMGFTYVSQSNELVIDNGKAFVLLPEEEDSQQPGVYRTRVSKGVETDLPPADRTFALQANAVNYVWLVSQASVDNDGGENDQPYFTTNTSGNDPDPSNGTLLLGLINTVNNTVTRTNESPNISADSLSVHHGITLGGDLTLTGDESTIQIGQGEGNGPHRVRFGESFLFESDRSDNSLAITNNEATNGFEQLVRLSRDGNVGFPSGSVGVGSDVASATYGSGTTLRVYEENDDEIAEVSILGDTQGSGLLYVGQSVSHGGGIAYNGDNTPEMPTGTDNISIYRRSEGDDHEVLWWEHQNNTAHFEGGIELDDNKITGVEDISFTGDADQSLYYTGSAGDFSIRDSSNNSEKVMSVGQGRMTVNRALRAAGGLQLTNDLQLNDNSIYGVAAPIVFSSPGGTAIDLATNSDGSHYIWNHTDGSGNQVSAHSQPDDYFLQLEREGSARHIFRTDGKAEHLDSGNDGIRLGAGNDRPYIAPIVNGNRQYGQELSHEGGSWVAESNFRIEGNLNMADGEVSNVERLSFNGDGNQQIQYHGSDGTFYIEDTDNNDNVFEVGAGHIVARRNVHHNRRTFINPRRGGDPDIDLAIGDNDSGIHWESDGRIGIYSNNNQVARFSPNPDAFIVRTKTRHENNVRMDNNRLTQTGYIYFTDQSTGATDPRVWVENGNLMYQSPNGSPEVVKYGP